MGSEVAGFEILTEGNYDQPKLDEFLQKFANFDKLDLYEHQLQELFEIAYPAEAKNTQEYENFKTSHFQQSHPRGSWVAYPWLGKVLHILNEKDYLAVRTNRNKYLLTDDEINKLQGLSVGVAGLSVGNSIARALDYSACCGQLTLADRDVFSLSNMNRVGVKAVDVGQSKLEVTTKQIYEVNPYAKIKGLPKGITPGNLNDFFEPSNFIAFDEIDDFEMKVRLRLAAKDRKIAVVMMTNLGDNVLVDIERHDSEEVEIFHGTASQAVKDILSGKLLEADMKRYAAQLVGIDNVPTRALQSLLDVGSKLVGRPQLYSSISVSAGLACFIVREIALNNSLSSGRYLFSLRDVFKLSRADLEISQDRLKVLKKLGG